MKNTEIKYYMYNSEKVVVKHNFILGDEKYAVVEGEHEGLHVARVDQLIEWEKSYQYLKQQEREAELQKMKEQEDKLAEQIQIKALESLEGRLRLNSAFSDDNKMSQVGLHFAGELKKILQTYDSYKLKNLNK